MSTLPPIPKILLLAIMSTAVVPMGLLVPEAPSAPPCKEFLIVRLFPYPESISFSLSVFRLLQTTTIRLRTPPGRGGTQLPLRVAYDLEGALLFRFPRFRVLIRLRGVSIPI